MPLSATAITEAILALERRLDLDDPVWTEGDVHWWPLYRTEIYRLLFVADAAGGRRSTGAVVVNSSRAVLYASAGADFAQAARAVADQTRQALNAGR